MFDREKASVREGEVLKGNPSWELRRHDVSCWCRCASLLGARVKLFFSKPAEEQRLEFPWQQKKFLNMLHVSRGLHLHLCANITFFRCFQRCPMKPWLEASLCVAGAPLQLPTVTKKQFLPYDAQLPCDSFYDSYFINFVRSPLFFSLSRAMHRYSRIMPINIEQMTLFLCIQQMAHENAMRRVSGQRRRRFSIES